MDKDNVIVIAGKLKFYNTRGEPIKVYDRNKKEMEDSGSRYIWTCIKRMQHRNFLRIQYTELNESFAKMIISMVLNSSSWIVHKEGVIGKVKGNLSDGINQIECIIKRKRVNEIPNAETI